MTRAVNKLSLITLIICSLFISAYRINNITEKEIAWDILGYYLPLPSTFIYNEPLLNNIDWLKKVNEEKNLTGTLYQVSTNDKGEPMYFFLFGMAILYLPFFLLSHGFALLGNYSADGFSLPYQYGVVIGAIIYTIIGLIYLRKILRHFFSEKISSLVILILVFGTNYIHHLTLKNLETVNALFMFMSILLWNTIKWHETKKGKNLFVIGLSITMMTLIKPSEVIVFLIPILWNVTSVQNIKQNFLLIFKNKRDLILTIIVCFLLVLPQMLYWQVRTGHYIYDSYKNPGVGLDIFSPHIFDVLFSYRKGWLVYTPVMIFSLIGFHFLFKSNKNIFIPVITYFLISFYIISSWTEWWYGAAFSCRPLITAYPLLAICLGYFLLHIQTQTLFTRTAFGAIVLFCIFQNQFQWWQLKNYILDPYRTTKEYYWASFLNSSVTEKDRELLLVNRDFSGNYEFKNKEKYYCVEIKSISFNEQPPENIQKDSTGNFFYRTFPDQEFALTSEYEFRELTRKDHVWLRVSMDIRFPEDFKGQLPCLVITMDHKGNYGYYAPEIKADPIGSWENFQTEYLTPEIRNTKDILKCYIWKRSKSTFDIKNFKIEIYEYRF